MLRYLLHPSLLLLIGVVAAICPVLFVGDYSYSYSGYESTPDFFLLQVIGYLMFIIGGGLSLVFHRIIFISINQVSTSAPSIQPFFLEKMFISRMLMVILLFISAVYFYLLYGGIPLLNIIMGNYFIGDINERQLDSNGVFGVVYLVFTFVMLTYPNSLLVQNERKDYILHFFQILIIIYFSIYSGKRQSLFIFFCYYSMFMSIYFIRENKYDDFKKLIKKSILVIIVLFLFFSIVGAVRSLDSGVSLLDPIWHYLSLPYINMMDIMLTQHTNSHAWSFDGIINIVSSGLPYSMRSMFNASDFSPTLLEPTSPSGVYELIFWYFGYIGSCVFMLILGAIMQYLYKMAFYSNDNKYVYLYSWCAWPLISIFMYNHFINYMNFFFPFVIVCGISFLQKVRFAQ